MADQWIVDLVASRRAVRARIAGEERWIAIEDVARYRDGVGVAPPVGVPDAFLGPAAAALEGLLARYARTHGPFLTPDPARRWGLPVGVVETALERLLENGTILRGEFRPGGAEREWLDPDVLRVLRRRSLARLRREVEPVDPAALGRFLPAWHGVTAFGEAAPAAPAVGRARAPRGGRRPARRPADPGIRAGAGRPAGTDPGLSAAAARRAGGDGRGRVGGAGEPRPRRWPDRARPARPRSRAAARRRPTARDRPAGPRHEAIRELLGRRGASFYREIFTAAGGGSDREVLDALWDLVWAGEVTNDTFAPLRALRWKRPARDVRRRPGRLTSLGPPEAAGRWSLVEDVVATPTERLHATALALLDRHGVVTREAVASEGVEGGFSAVYPILRMLEEAGRIRRGYFVDGLGAAQFALAGALERLRAVREPARAPGERETWLLAAADPANPYGAAIPWPRRGEADRRPFQRAAGAYVAVVDGSAALYLERGGGTIQTLPASDDPEIADAALRSLHALVDDRRVRELVITKVDGGPVGESPLRDRLVAAGFSAGYRGLVLRAGR